MNKLIVVIGGPYNTQKIRVGKSGTFIFKAKGLTGFYQSNGVWSDLTPQAK